MSDKAKGHSISFDPDSLYVQAVDYAARQDPPRSASSVICEALKDYLKKNDPTVSDANADMVEQVKVAADRDPTLASDVLAFIRSRKRKKARRP